MESELDTLNGLPILFFAQPQDWESWLRDHHQDSRGTWVRMAKKDSGTPSITYDQALDVALCYGWIDGQKKTYDATSWLQKFTPRGAKSVWSKVNCEHVERLTAAGRMQPAGLRAVAAAKEDGRWEAAYDSAGKATVPPDFEAALEQNERANAFWSSLNRTNRYAMLWRIQTAKKAATRAQRIEKFIHMLENHEKLYP